MLKTKATTRTALPYPPGLKALVASGLKWTFACWLEREMIVLQLGMSGRA